jgi:O-antigen/teichoic acid export membrane protein
MLKKLFSHTFIYGLANQIPKIAGVFALPFITKCLTEQDYGIYGVIVAYTSALEVFGSLGLRVTLVNSFYKYPTRYPFLWREIYGFLMVWNIVFAFIKALIIYLLLPAEIKSPLLVVFLTTGMNLFFGPTGTFGMTLYQIKQKPIPIAIRTMLLGMLTVVLNIFFIAHLKLGYLGWFYSTFIVSLLMNASYLYPLIYTYNLRPIFKISFRRIWSYLKVTLPTIPHFYSMYLLNSSDRAVMKQMSVPIGDIGQYTSAYTVANLFQSVGMVSGTAIGPLMNECYKENNDKGARNLVFVLQGCYLIASFIACIWLKEIFFILIKNKELALTYPLGIILVMGYNYRGMYYGAVNKLFYLEKTNILWKITFIAGVFNVLANLILMPFFGYKVAAYTTFVSLMFMGYSGYFLKSFKENNSVKFYPILWILITILLTIAAYVCRDLSLMIKLLMSCVGVAISLVIVKRYYFLFKKML